MQTFLVGGGLRKMSCSELSNEYYGRILITEILIEPFSTSGISLSVLQRLR